MAKMKFPNPKFFRAKDNVDWKAQGRNLQEVGGIIWDMLKETDWKAFAAKQKANVQDNVRRGGPRGQDHRRHDPRRTAGPAENR